MDKLIEKDWEIATETLAHGLLGWSADEQARQFAAFIRESVTPDAVMALSTAADEFDVNDLLAQVRAPTLVLHRRQFSFPEVDVARGLASQIPNARLALLEGESPAPFLGDTDAVLEAVDEFLGEGEGEEVAAYAAPSGLVTILFTDMEGSTTLTQRIGDARAQEVLHAHNAIVRDALKAHGGSETKHTGDGIMASFTTASRALACAIAMQRAFAAHNRGVEAALAPPQGAASDDPTAPTATEPIRVRVGLNAGEPVAEGDPDGRADLFGTAVQLAARICAHAEPGQILASNVVQELAAGKDFAFADQGDVALKGFEKPVRLFEVRWREGA